MQSSASDHQGFEALQPGPQPVLSGSDEAPEFQFENFAGDNPVSVPFAVAPQAGEMSFISNSSSVGISHQPSLAPYPPSMDGEGSLAFSSNSLHSFDKRSLDDSSRFGGSRSTTAKRARTESRSTGEVTEDEEDRDRRRIGRNLREQQRSQKITQQIAELRNILGAANVSFKPDKYSTLVKVSEYIKELQAKSAALDQEHQKLLSTVHSTSTFADTSQGTAATKFHHPDLCRSKPEKPTSDAVPEKYASILSIDYQGLFSHSCFPMALASVDGRFLDCNDEFLRCTGYSRQELIHESALDGASASVVSADSNGSPTAPYSLFSILHKDGMEALFTAMSRMLQQPSVDDPVHPFASNLAQAGASSDHWSGPMILSRFPNRNVRMDVGLVRCPSGRAKFFSIVLMPTS